MWYAHRTHEIDRVFLSAFVLGSSTRKPTQQSVSEFNQPGQFLLLLRDPVRNFVFIFSTRVHRSAGEIRGRSWVNCTHYRAASIAVRSTPTSGPDKTG